MYRSMVLKPVKSGAVPVVPGKPGQSELIKRILTDDPDDVMPPTDEHPEGLSREEKDILLRWVEQGADWTSHWAFEKPVPRKAPQPKEQGWAVNDVDRYVLARLEKQGIEPAQDETPSRWLRRLSLDLIGLPPTPKQVSVFERDLKKNGDAAYERVVDGLLTSPRFGERWASVWLDQVRYADSRGLGQDGKRNIWKYRDWVINAYNTDMPYDVFTKKQIAGDMRGAPSMDDLIATAVHRVTQSNEEGGTDDEEFRVMAVLDRVNTTWQTWQGVTFGCVQCHNHPYDPFSQEEYYRFAAFFNNTQDVDLNEDWPLVQAPIDPARYDEASALDRRASVARQAAFDRQHPLLMDQGRWRPLVGIDVTTSNQTRVKTKRVGDTEQYHTVGTVTRNTDFTVEAPRPEGGDRLTAVRVNAMPLNPKNAVSDAEIGFALSHIEASLTSRWTRSRIKDSPRTAASITRGVRRLSRRRRLMCRPGRGCAWRSSTASCT
ncbi:MAG: DUF1549 domain-containing protein [Planctomycetota bacterium]